MPTFYIARIVFFWYNILVNLYKEVDTMEMDGYKKEDIKKRVLADIDPELKKQKKKERRKYVLITIIQFIAIIVLILGLFFALIGTSTVDGNSMYPTLHNTNKVFYSRISKEYKVGDIVAIKMDNGNTYVKRIIAIPGDTVNIQHGKVYINGKEEVNANALGETKGSDIVKYPYLVEDGSYFVLGDNREVSDDSRNFGAIHSKQIQGKIIFYFGVVE